MNLKRIVFVAVGILIMLVIIAFTLHSMAHIDEINQNRRDKNKGEQMASQIIMTTATTDIWEKLRPPVETESESGSPQEENVPVTEAVDEENAEIITENTFQQETISIPQTYTETIEQGVIS